MPSADRGDRRLTIAFVSLAGAFLIGAIALSTINRSSGSPDSQNFLDTARNIAAGAGFSSHIVQQHFVQQSLPHHENFRPPGAAYVTAAAFRLFGVSLAIPVILNGIVVILAALLLRQAIRVAGSPRLGSLAGILLLVSGNYSLISVWNNNYLVLCTTALLLCLAIAERRRHPAWVWAICCGVIGALGFLMKPTFLLTAIPFAVFLVGRTANPEGSSLQRRAPATVLFLALFIVLTAPYWGGNLLRTGRPIDSPVMAIRLSERYRALPYKTWWTVRFDRPLGYGELVRTFGAAEVLRKEGSRWLRAVGRIISLNPPIFFLAAVGCLIWLRREPWGRYLGPILLMTEPIFSGGLYAKPIHRYFWPILPCLLYIAGLLARELSERSSEEPRTSHLRIIGVLLLIAAVPFGGFRALKIWTTSFREAVQPPPAWAPHVRSLPPDAVVITENPWQVAWEGERRAVICPAGSREDLLEVLRRYRPDYYVYTGRGFGRGEPAWTEGDLEPVIVSDEGWEVHRLKLRIPREE